MWLHFWGTTNVLRENNLWVRFGGTKNEFSRKIFIDRFYWHSIQVCWKTIFGTGFALEAERMDGGLRRRGRRREREEERGRGYGIGEG